MNTKPPNGQGPFQRGEILTAAKLNDVVRAIPTVQVYGSGHVEGQTVLVDERESMYIRLTNKTGSAPIKYAWQEVFRETNGTWTNTTHNATVTDDYAIEINNSNLSVTDNYVYRAERSRTTGEWLFFLRRSAVADCVGGICSNPPTTIYAEFPPVSYPYSSPPIYNKTVGEILYYPPPDDACPWYEWPDGLTAHAWYLDKKAKEIVSTSVAANATVGFNAQTTIDVGTDIEPFMPIISEKRYEGSGACPCITFERSVAVEMISAERLVDTLLLNNGSCGFDLSIIQKVRITIRIVKTETTYFLGTPTTTVSAGFWDDIANPLFITAEGIADSVSATVDAVNTTYYYDMAPTSLSTVIGCDVSNVSFVTESAIYGGDAESAFTEAYYGGNSTSSFTEAIYGGSE